VPQPGDADAVAGQETVGTLAELDDFADYLVPRDHPGVARLQLTLSQVQVGAADSAGPDPDKHLASGRNRHWTLDQGQRGLIDRLGVAYHPGTHLVRHEVLRIVAGPITQYR
jgi:hypothetical protein